MTDNVEEIRALVSQGNPLTADEGAYLLAEADALREELDRTRATLTLTDTKLLEALHREERLREALNTIAHGMTCSGSPENHVHLNDALNREQLRDVARTALEPSLPERNDMETLQQQVDRLAKFIMEEVPGEPSQSEGAVDTAIRIIRDLREELERWKRQWIDDTNALEDERDALRSVLDSLVTSLSGAPLDDYVTYDLLVARQLLARPALDPAP